MDGIQILIQTYVSLVKSGKIKLSDIPDRYKESVKNVLLKESL